MAIKFILASSSPRRKEILESLGLKVEIIKPDYEEKFDDFYDGLAAEIALNKYNSLNDSLKNNENIIITADTLVVCEKHVFGKPKNKKDAYFMLNKLNDKWHGVYSGLCVAYKDKIFFSEERTNVKFRKLSDKELNAYLDTKEPYDKAGAYGIQGKGRLLVEKIDGCFFNVMGLPIGLLYDFLKKINYNLLIGG